MKRSFLQDKASPRGHIEAEIPCRIGWIWRKYWNFANGIATAPHGLHRPYTILFFLKYLTSKYKKICHNTTVAQKRLNDQHLDQGIYGFTFPAVLDALSIFKLFMEPYKNTVSPLYFSQAATRPWELVNRS